MPERKPLTATAVSPLADIESSLRPVSSQLAEFDRLNAVYGNNALDDIHRQMQGTSAAQAALDAVSSSRAHEEILRAVNPAGAELDRLDALYGNSAMEELQRQMQPTSAAQAAMDAMSSARAHDHILRSVYPAASELERMKAAYGSSSAFDDIQRHMQSMSDTQAILDSLTRPEPPAELFQLPIDYSNTPMRQTASAAIETAEHVSKVSELTVKMVSDVSSLTKSIVYQALPAWMEQQKSAQEAANLSHKQSQDAAAKSSKQANISLIVAAVALVASVIVTIAVAWWQVAVTKNLAAETAAQQVDSDKEQTKRHEDTLKALQAQVTAQRELIEQQHKVSESLRTALAGLKPPPATAQER